MAGEGGGKAQGPWLLHGHPLHGGEGRGTLGLGQLFALGGYDFV